MAARTLEMRTDSYILVTAVLSDRAKAQEMASSDPSPCEQFWKVTGPRNPSPCGSAEEKTGRVVGRQHGARVRACKAPALGRHSCLPSDRNQYGVSTTV